MSITSQAPTTNAPPPTAEDTLMAAAFAEEIGFGRDWKIIAAPWPHAQQLVAMLRGFIGDQDERKLHQLKNILSSLDGSGANLDHRIEIPGLPEPSAYQKNMLQFFEASGIKTKSTALTPKEASIKFQQFAKTYRMHGDLGDTNTMVFGPRYLAELLTKGWPEVADGMRKCRGGFDSIGQRIDAELKLDSIKDKSGHGGFAWQLVADEASPRAYSALVATAELEHVKLQLHQIFGDNFEIKADAAPGRLYIGRHSSPQSRIHITIPQYPAQEPTPETFELRGGFDTIRQRVEAELKLADIRDPKGELYGLHWQREMQTRITNENGQPLISPIYKATTAHSQVEAIEEKLKEAFGEQIEIVTSYKGTNKAERNNPDSPWQITVAPFPKYREMVESAEWPATRIGGGALQPRGLVAQMLLQNDVITAKGRPPRGRH